MAKQKTINIKLNVPMLGKKKGHIERVKVDDKGTPLDSFWRKRIRDAEIDKCVEVVSEKKPKASS